VTLQDKSSQLTTSPKAPVPPPDGKRKGNTPQSLVPSIVDHDDLSEGSIVSEIEIEYDENASVEESDDSGSEFEASEDSGSELEYVVKSRKSPRKRSLPVTDEDFLVDDESSDEVMLDAAIQASLQTAHLDQAARNGVGSSRQSVSSYPAAALRAAAAERRLARANQAVDVDDDAAFILEYESDALSSSEEEALSKAKSKGKGKAPNKSATVYDTTSTKFMSISERRRFNRERRKLTSASKKENRKEELKMVKLLGRPLTYVRL
jgi:DNA repair protein RAD16